MKMNDVVTINDGLYKGQIAYFLDHPKGRKTIANVQLEDGMAEIQVFTDQLTPHLTAEGESKVMDKVYMKDELVYNPGNGMIGRSDHVKYPNGKAIYHIDYGQGRMLGSYAEELLHLWEVTDSEALVYALAYYKGLVKDTDTLEIKAPVRLPEEGTYWLKCVDYTQNRVVIVRNNKVYSQHVMQKPETNSISEVMWEITDWVLRKLEEGGSLAEFRFRA